MKRAKTIALLATLFSLCAAHAQVAPSPKSPGFDVVSIRQCAPNAIGWSQDMTPNSITFKGTLKLLIHFAYGVKIEDILGGPRWTDDVCFDLYAKVAPEDLSVFNALPLLERKATLQGVLADRFGLQTHLEPRTVSVYRLTTKAGGRQLKLHKPADNQNPQNPLTLPGSISFDSHEFTGDGISIATLIRSLEPLIHITILDDTGRTGLYDVHLNWSPDCDPSLFANGATATCEASSADPSPPIFAALEQQLGLKLTRGKGLVQHLAIDHAHLPTQN